MGEAGETPWPRGAHTGGAWLSSARVVRCLVKSSNERNPRRMLPAGRAGHPCGTAGAKPEEGGDDVKSSCPLCPGLHTCYSNERNPRRMLPAGRAGHPCGTAGAKPEEGGDDVKSSCPLCPGLHTCYNGRYSGMRWREPERIPQSRPQFGLGAATRPHEVGVASNRGSACRGECVPGPCTHRPSHHPSRLPMARAGADPSKPAPVRIGGCNPPP